MTLTTAGRTVAFSAITVAISVGGMLIFSAALIRGIGGGRSRRRRHGAAVRSDSRARGAVPVRTSTCPAVRADSDPEA